jgi:hypothetical protein
LEAPSAQSLHEKENIMKKFVAATLSAFAFLALAACTEGDPGMAPDQPQQPMEEPEPAPLD